ncbi:hypothetical protein SeMB42_g04649 [Synchytrium endobioticum]|uniref:Rad60/SUMO-like domain-containing protein n=1 Tax=Synchytrium endobioticum TaxID=286115 RepID=A0A507CK87_9FUNG|nr:hypothetical protein SeLEV6574_g07629 [Synchytrium endobioticum]TPX43639.1 hypothetical protein SeMB42_g04649 [Synchytrium endobioticum]
MQADETVINVSDSDAEETNTRYITTERKKRKAPMSIAGATKKKTAHRRPPIKSTLTQKPLSAPSVPSNQKVIDLDDDGEFEFFNQNKKETKKTNASSSTGMPSKHHKEPVNTSRTASRDEVHEDKIHSPSSSSSSDSESDDERSYTHCDKSNQLVGRAPQKRGKRRNLKSCSPEAAVVSADKSSKRDQTKPKSISLSDSPEPEPERVSAADAATLRMVRQKVAESFSAFVSDVNGNDDVVEVVTSLPEFELAPEVASLLSNRVTGNKTGSYLPAVSSMSSASSNVITVDDEGETKAQVIIKVSWTTADKRTGSCKFKLNSVDTFEIMMDSVAGQMQVPETGEALRRAYDFKYNGNLKLLPFGTPESLKMHLGSGKVQIDVMPRSRVSILDEQFKSNADGEAIIADEDTAKHDEEEGSKILINIVFGTGAKDYFKLKVKQATQISALMDKVTEKSNKKCVGITLDGDMVDPSSPISMLELEDGDSLEAKLK